ncbi:hypothetical protein DV735_g1672, partial [Chaetothyriales sp. CBS 134920]
MPGKTLWLHCRAILWLLPLLSCILHVSADESQQPLTSTAGPSSNHSNLWTCAPNLYFGVRPRLPRSLQTGLLWANADSFPAFQPNLRHTCEQHQGMQGYGWDEYDNDRGGRHVIHDTGNKIDLVIEFVKVPGAAGGSWAARVKGTLREDAPATTVTSLFFYAGFEGLGELAWVDGQNEKETLTLKGQLSGLGEFTIDVTQPPDTERPYKIHPSWDTKPLDRDLITSVQVPPEAVWQAKHIILADIKPNFEAYLHEYGQDNMPPPWQAFTISDDPKPGNFHVLQKVLVGNFEFDILFSSGADQRLTSTALDAHIASSSQSFKYKFAEIFQPLAPFNKAKYRPFSESLFSNLIGGLGYFYGDSLVDRSYAPEYDEENEGFWDEAEEARARAQVSRDPPTELLTTVPSRPFFPRGFLWDEGFHLLPIAEWDLDLTLDILQSWFNLIDEDGWIAREQILGPEARSKVPAEFQVQYPHYANPPTLFITVETLVAKVNSGALSAEQSAKVKSALAAIYPLLKRQYYWFRKTQFGDIKSYDRVASSTREAYRWRGRTPRHILTSGLDDYPRAQPPHPGELHVDLMSWVGLMQRTLASLAGLLSETEDHQEFRLHHVALLKNLDDLHWSSDVKAYCDATIDDYEEHVLVCHLGYISLFPFLTGLLPATHPHLPHLLDLIASPDKLWSPYGIRSLSVTDPNYGTDENYWRSPIWVNINYLILKNLLATATAADAPTKVRNQARTLYTDLRTNLVENVYQQWKDTGFAWEQYNPDSGSGQRTQHFTGWTSLVVLIMRLPDLSTGGVKHAEL